MSAAPPIVLEDEERSELERIVGAASSEVRMVQRARIVLRCADGHGVNEITEQLGCSPPTVSKWRGRYAREGIEALGDAPRPGPPLTHGPETRAILIAKACTRPPETPEGARRERWTYEELGEEVGMSASQAHVILSRAEIKPHRVKMWCHSTDPDYQKKMRSIVRLYVRRPKGEPVLCIDEKTGMQALSRARELQPAAPRRAARFEFEYQRNGTRCLFGCFNIATGQVLGRCTRSRKRPDFLGFMDLVASVYRQPRVHVVLDNLNTHKDTNQGDFVTEWNRSHGRRFVFHYTPTHGSWLNQIELWFGIVSRRVLRHGQFRSPDSLVAAIESFIDTWNRLEAHPFRWTYEGLPLVR